MQKLATFFISCSLLILGNTAFAQNTCCATTVVAPEVQSGFYTPNQIAPTDSTPVAPVGMVASSDLPDTEFLITKRGVAALDSVGQPDPAGGDVVLGADADGIFTPNDMSRYGITLAPDDTFDVTAVGFDLDQIKNLADSLLNGITASGPCCNLFIIMAAVVGDDAIKGFCDTVNNAGIYGASDIDGMNEVLTVFDAFGSAQISIPNLISTLELINQYGNVISTDCGGTGASNFLPYGVNKDKAYGYDVVGPIAVQKLSDVSLFMMYPNPTPTGDVNIYFTTSKEVNLAINVIDALGKRVYSNTLGSVSGDFTAQIPTHNLNSGIYFVELTDGENSTTKKLIVR
jgi:hypothetical protein